MAILSRHNRAEEGELWRSLLGILSVHADYEQRLDAVLAKLGELAGVPDLYVYLAEEGGRRFHLEQSRARPALDPTRAAPGPMTQTVEGGAGWIAPTPPLELVRTPEDEHERVVRSPVGQLYSVPLRVADDLVGLVLAGPLAGGELDAAPRARLHAAAVPAAIAVAQARREHTLATELAAAKAREDAGRRLMGSALDLERFLGLLLELALRTTGSEAGFIAIVQEGEKAPGIRVQANLPETFTAGVDLSPQTGLFDWSAAEVGALSVSDIEAAAALGIRSIVAVPLVEDAEPLGILALVNFEHSGAFDEQSLELLGTLSDQVRLMLHNDRLFRGFSDRYLETVKGLASSLDARRPHTQDHHRHVSAVAAALAQELSLSEQDADAIRTAGLIHDVGLLGVFGGGGAFETDVEHPAIGASMVGHLPLPRAVAESVAAHHEWFDGWGFPAGLKGQQIPLGGRVMAAAEFVVEMAQGDPVRAPWGAEQLAAELRQRSGSQFEPRIAEAAARVVTAADGTLLGTPSATQED